MSTLSVETINSLAASTPPVVRDSGGTQIGTFCRAWVNFNGTGTVAITGSFNVSSVTDNNVGDYTINFATAMPDAAYACVATTVQRGGGGSPTNNASLGFGGTSTSSAIGTYSSSAVQVFNQSSSGTATDRTHNSIAIFR